jgi:hypothetical protein
VLMILSTSVWLSYRYGVGLTDVAISILILVLMVFLLPGRSFGWRAPRLVSVLFASFGAMQTYSVCFRRSALKWGRRRTRRLTDSGGFVCLSMTLHSSLPGLERVLYPGMGEDVEAASSLGVRRPWG